MFPEEEGGPISRRKTRVLVERLHSVPTPGFSPTPPSLPGSRPCFCASSLDVAGVALSWHVPNQT